MEWVVLAGIGAAILVYVLYRMFKQQGERTAAGRTGPGAVEGDGEADHRVLLNMVLGDREKAERLIEYERRKDPGAGRPRLIRSAIERLRDDMRR